MPEARYLNTRAAEYFAHSMFVLRSDRGVNRIVPKLQHLSDRRCNYCSVFIDGDHRIYRKASGKLDSLLCGSPGVIEVQRKKPLRIVCGKSAWLLRRSDNVYVELQRRFDEGFRSIGRGR